MNSLFHVLDLPVSSKKRRGTCKGETRKQEVPSANRIEGEGHMEGSRILPSTHHVEW